MSPQVYLELLAELSKIWSKLPIQQHCEEMAVIADLFLHIQHIPELLDMPIVLGDIFGSALTSMQQYCKEKKNDN